MRTPSLLVVALLVVALTGSTSVAQPASGATTCASCHLSENKSQPHTLMARALELKDANPTLQQHPKLTYRLGAYTYTIETRGMQSTYTVQNGAQSLSVPILWSFGAEAQTWVLEHEGKLYESLVSFYPSVDRLDLTVGDNSLTPGTLLEAMGRELPDRDVTSCFGCHTSGGVVNGKLSLATMKPGVTCEHCHLGSAAHMADAANGKFDSAPPYLAEKSSEDISNFCGQCHRTWETVVRNHWLGESDVRFQPYRLANSKCFDGTDKRISCIACHNPHINVVRDTISYDAKCLACHASGTQRTGVDVRVQVKACPVAHSNCASCHMPKVKLPGGHQTFTDHQIRIVRAGEPYPN